DSDVGDGTYTANVNDGVIETVTITATINGQTITTGNPTVAFAVGVADETTSIISVSSGSVTTDDTVTVTVQAKDAAGNDLPAGTDTVVISSSLSGVISNDSDVGDGTYTADLNDGTIETVTISATINGNTITTGNPTVAFAVGAADETTSTISVSSGSVTTDDTVTVTVQAKDAAGNNLTAGTDTVVISSSLSGAISNFNDNGDGTYTADLNDAVLETVTITATINGNGITTGNPTVAFSIGAADETTSTISVSSGSVTTDDTVTVTVQAKDAAGNNLTAGTDTVVITSNLSGAITNFNDNGDGTYTADLNDAVLETVTITATINGNGITTGNPTVAFAIGAADETTSTISVSSASVTTDDTVILTVQAIDAAGNNLIASGGAVAFSTTGSAIIASYSDNNDGTYTANITNGTVETVTISATINGDTITTGNPTIAFAIGAADETVSTISVSSASVTTDDTVVLTVQAIDTAGNNLIASGGPVVFSTTGSAIIASYSDNNDGTYTANITNGTVETVTISATINGDTITTGNPTIAYAIGAADETVSTISVSSASVSTDDTVVLTVQAIDAAGNNLIASGGPVVFSTTGAAIIASYSDNNDGTYTANITNGTVETVTISATINGDTITTGNPTITFAIGIASKDTSTIAVSSGVVTTDDTVVLSVQAIDAAGNNLTTSGGPVAFSTSGAAIIAGYVDNNDGTYNAIITNANVETVTITATINGATITTGNPTITFNIGAADINTSTITVSSAAVTTDDTVTITVQAKDAAGNNLITSGGPVTLASTGSGIISVVADNNDGTYTATITDAIAENVTISGTINTFTIIDTASVAFAPGIANATQTTISVNPGSVVADSVSTSLITVQAIDAQGNNLISGGDSIVLSENGSGIISGITDNGDGTYSATVTNTVAETITISGTINALAITGTASVTFIPGAASGLTTTISVASASVTTDSVTTTTITVQTIDVQGNVLVIGGDAIALSNSGTGIISGVIDLGNGTYTAIISNTTAESIIVSGTVNAATITDTAAITFTPGIATTANTMISASAGNTTADGTSTSTIIVQTVDAQGNSLTIGGDTIALTENGNAIIGAVNDLGDGAYTATITNTTAEVVTVSGTLNTFAITDTADVSFVPDAASAAQTTISATPASLEADGSTIVTITVQAIDPLGNNLVTGGDVITLAENGNAIISGIIDMGDGTYTATMTNTVAEIITISGTINTIAIVDVANVTYLPGTVSTAQTTITAAPTTVTADGVATSTITVQAKDAQGNNLVSGGLSIVLTDSGNAILSGTIDVGDGTYTATITNTLAELVTVSGTIAATAITDTASINFIPGAATTAQSTISATPITLVADGVTTSTITIQTTDAQGNNLTAGGEAIVLSQGGNATISSVVDNGDGTYTATMINAMAEVITVSGTLNGSAIPDTATVTFTPGIASTAFTTITTSITSLTADGIATSAITIQTIDSFGNNVTAGGLTITLTQDGSAAISNVTDNGDGTYSAAITSTVAELVTISGNIGAGAITDVAIVTFVPGPLVIAQTTIVGSSTTVIADGTTQSTITVQARDVFDNPLTTGGLTVLLTTTGNATISAVVDNNDGTGTYTATITSTDVETVTISATMNSTAFPDTETIDFVPGPIVEASSIITASPSVVTADGNDSAVLTVETFDAQGHPLVAGGHTVVLIDDSQAILSAINDNNDGTYTATITSNTPEFTTINGSINGFAVTDNEIINFVEGGPAQVNTSDGNFVNGVGPAGATIEVKDSLGNTVCTTTTDLITGDYHCLITAPLPNGEVLTVLTTDLAGNDETTTVTLNTLDTDDDGISNVVESLLSYSGGASNTQPNTDSDGDGLPDYAEIILGSDFLAVHSPVIDGDFDSDLDGISDAVEYFFDSAGGAIDTARITDTDFDGIPDITELLANKSDFNHADLPIINGAGDDDGDNVTNAVEYYLSTFSFVNVDETSDYDHDGYSDALEVRLASNPLKANEADIDSDGVSDAVELFITGTMDDGINTSLLDSDGDSLPDILELTLDTDMTDPFAPINDSQNGDADFDGMTDAVELYIGGDTTTATLSQDSDNDGITDIAEIFEGSDPFADSTPTVWINVSDLGGGSVEITAVMGGYQAPYPSFTWDTSDIFNANPSAMVIDTNSQSLSISGLETGKHSVSVTLTKIIDGVAFSSTVSQLFATSMSGVEDADYDGISDTYDTSDGTSGSEESLSTAIGSDDNYEVQLEYGVGVRAGLIARMGDNQISTITNEQLTDYINQDFPITAGDTSTNNNITATPNLFDIDIVNIPSSGDTIDMVVPLNRPLSSNAAVLIFDHVSATWAFMDTDGADSISSTMGSPGSCPPIGDPSYTPGITEGGYCLQLALTDGGPNDRDTSINGSIPLLVGIGSSNHLANTIELDDGQGDIVDGGVPTSQTDDGSSDIVSTSTSGSDGDASGGGGSVNPITLLFLMLGSLGLYRNASRRQR
ncbi:MAG: hypothetical protein COA99_14445, partial [Moraxellaceae bacterium]